MAKRLGVSLKLFIACAALTLAGCASRPPALLIANPSQPDGAKHVELLAISTRAASPIEGELYSGERSREPSAYAINVSIPPNHELGQVEWPKREIADPETEFSVADLAPVPLDGVEEWFKAQNSDGRLLVFVHGYNVSFPDAVFRLAQLTNDASITAAPVLFTWPSRGDLVGYYYDRESASFARDPMEFLLSEAAKNENVTEITILAHSMGSWIVMETLRQMAIREGRVPDKVTDVILAAPDLDIDVFEQQFLTLGEERPHFTFLVSSDDRALGISRMLAGGVQRVGAVDPSQGALSLAHRSDSRADGGRSI